MDDTREKRQWKIPHLTNELWIDTLSQERFFDKKVIQRKSRIKMLNSFRGCDKGSGRILNKQQEEIKK